MIFKVFLPDGFRVVGLVEIRDKRVLSATDYTTHKWNNVQYLKGTKGFTEQSFFEYAKKMKWKLVEDKREP